MLCFFAAAQHLTPSRWLRFAMRRLLEIVRAFPEIVIAGFFLAIFSLGPIPAILAVSIHTVGALGKMFFEVVENADMKPDEGLRAVGANWVERVWFGIVPQVLPNFLSYSLLRLRDQRARLDHHRRGRRRRHRRGAAPVDQPRPRGQDASPSSSCCFRTIIAVDQFSAWLRRRLVGEQAFEFGRGRLRHEQP